MLSEAINLAHQDTRRHRLNICGGLICENKIKQNSRSFTINHRPFQFNLVSKRSAAGSVTLAGAAIDFIPQGGARDWRREKFTSFPRIIWFRGCKTIARSAFENLDLGTRGQRFSVRMGVHNGGCSILHASNINKYRHTAAASCERAGFHCTRGPRTDAVPILQPLSSRIWAALWVAVPAPICSQNGAIVGKLPPLLFISRAAFATRSFCDEVALQKKQAILPLETRKRTWKFPLATHNLCERCCFFLPCQLVLF